MALSWTMDKNGPLTRSVEDAAIVFNAIHGSDGRDDTVVDAPFAWDPAVIDAPLSKLRIAYLPNEFEPNPNAVGGRGGGRGGVDPEVARRRAAQRLQTLKDALDVMRAQGAKLEPIALPDFPTNAIN